MTTVVPIDVAALGTLRPDGGRCVTREDVKKAQASRESVIVDLRSKSNFSGTTKKDYVRRSGHIPGAISQPAPTFVEGVYATFKGPKVIRGLLGADVGSVDRPILTYCNSGRAATVGYVAYRIAGFEKVAVYDGAMAEWGNDAACAVSTGAK